MSDTTPHLSLITPVRGTLPALPVANLQRMLAELESLGRDFELIVVCDGGFGDGGEFRRNVTDDRVTVVGYAQNRGKGYAISFGIAHARGRFIGWLDSDLDLDPSAIVAATEELERFGLDAVIGSKRHPDSAVDYPLTRRVLSAGYQVVTRLLFRVNVRDTQVGAKVFRREMLDTVAPLLLVKRYAFDLEVLAVGAEFGFDRIAEVPVTLAYQFSGSGINAAAVRNMLVDTLAIGYRIHVRHWYVRQFAAWQRTRADAAVGSLSDGEPTSPAAERGNLSEIRASLG